MEQVKSACDESHNTENSPHHADLGSNQCELFLIIHHPCNPQVLLSTHPSRGQLPCLTTKPRPRGFFFEKTSDFLPEAQQYFGITFKLTLLRCMWYKRYNKRDLEDDLFRAIIVVESHGATVEPPDGTEWLHPSCILFPQAAVRDGKGAIERFFEECRTGLQPVLRPLFARRGWYESAVEWMKNQLSSKDFDPISEVAQVQCTYRGVVLKAELSNGEAVYLKCSPYFTNEASSGRLLADLIPQFVATPIATDVERRLLLMRDYGEIISPLRLDSGETLQWVNELAEIHQSTIAKEQVLLDVGLRLLTFETMETELDNVVHFAEQAQLVNTEFIHQFQPLLDQIRRDCRNVTKLGIPLTFVHGDLYFSNVYRNNGTSVSHGIMDFTESAVSHPFIDILSCRDRGAYSENWMHFLGKNFPCIARKATKEMLLESQALCIRLCSLWEAVRLYQEMEAVERPIPPQMLSDLRGELMCLFRTYTK